MKKSLRAIIFLTAAAVTAAFFLPWISMEVSGVKLVQISGFDILREVNSAKKIFGDTLSNFRIKLLLIPALSIYIIIAILKKWNSAFYVIPVVLVFAYYVYLIFDTYKIISTGLEILGHEKDILDKISRLKEINEKTIQIDYKIIGKGLYITVFGFIFYVILGLKEMFTREKRW